ncbi:hypothetical protein [Massilia sp. METH4]|uniref:hypothetical protein n=1 Tax=Massilia sp. METH4 TaxID=3123041 RepID=UPI0030D32535
MRTIRFLVAVWFGLVSQHSVALENKPPPLVKFVVGKAKNMGVNRPASSVSVETLKLEAVEGMQPKILDRVNAQLRGKQRSIQREIKLCGSYAEGRPWSFHMRFNKVYVSDHYISVVFERSTVCAGSPNIEKIPMVFSRANGSLIPAPILVRQFVSAAAVVTPGHEGKVELDEESIGKMIADSEAEGISSDDRCDFYLKNSPYSVWVDAKNLVLSPEFTQTHSGCMKEYVFKEGK